MFLAEFHELEAHGGREDFSVGREGRGVGFDFLCAEAVTSGQGEVRGALAGGVAVPWRAARDEEELDDG